MKGKIINENKNVRKKQFEKKKRTTWMSYLIKVHWPKSQTQVKLKYNNEFSCINNDASQVIVLFNTLLILP